MRARRQSNRCPTVGPSNTGKGFDFAQVADATLSLFDLIAAQEAGEAIDCGDAIAVYQAALDQQTALLKDTVTAMLG